jgi:hypothetical protein
VREKESNHLGKVSRLHLLFKKERNMRGRKPCCLIDNSRLLTKGFIPASNHFLPTSCPFPRDQRRAN